MYAHNTSIPFHFKYSLKFKYNLKFKIIQVISPVISWCQYFTIEIILFKLMNCFLYFRRSEEIRTSYTEEEMKRFVIERKKKPLHPVRIYFIIDILLFWWQEPTTFYFMTKVFIREVKIAKSCTVSPYYSVGKWLTIFMRLLKKKKTKKMRAGVSIC